jgi:hypothetical protein
MLKEGGPTTNYCAFVLDSQPRPDFFVCLLQRDLIRKILDNHTAILFQGFDEE